MTFVRCFYGTLAAVLLGLFSWELVAEPIHVRQPEGRLHGFLVLRSASGAIIGRGDLVQTVEGDRVILRSLYSFSDGSVDEETTVFTQRSVFRLVSDHHVQRGPFFPKASDVLVEGNGQVTVRTVEKGKEKVEMRHIDLPDDLANGMLGIDLANVGPEAPEFRLSLLAGVGKGRLVKLDIAPMGKGSFVLGGVRRTANIFRIKAELGGVAAIVAPLLGKQPEDSFVWVVEGAAPVLVRGVEQLSVDGPTVSVEVAGGSFPKVTSPK